MQTIIKKTLVAILAAIAVTGGAAAQSEEFVVPLSAPDRPVTLEVGLSQGGLVIEGFDGNQVVVESRAIEDDEDEVERVDGMFRIPNNSVGLTIEEDDNTVTIDTDWSGNGVNLHVKVPRRTSLKVQIVNGEDLMVSGVSGEHELKNVNGSIEAKQMRGSVVASASNGDITIELLEISADTPMSFVSWNGDVDVTFPADLRATLKMQAGQGDILTDFQVQLQPTAPSRTQNERGKGYRVELNREIVGTVGGGGPEMRFKTFNGDVLVRKIGA